MTFTIPGEPVGKGRPRVVRKGNFSQTYTPEKTATYENLVKLEFQRQCGERFTDQQLHITIKAFFGLAKGDSRRKRAAKLCGAIRPTKKPDADNILKCVADALNTLAYNDDSQIVKAVVEKHFAEIPHVEVTIEEAHNEDYQTLV